MLAGLTLAHAAPAAAVVTPPVTVDGPSSEILDFGGVAIAPDGSGGLVYLKAVEGVPHVFACRYLGGRWSPPMRVDWDQPLAAAQPRISAGPDGELMVAWVTKAATVHGKVQYALFSSRIGAGGNAFGHSLLVDPNVGEGVGVAPALAAVAPGKAMIAYRVITYTFPPNTFSSFVQLRPGDVMAELRLARLNGDRWSRLGAINRNVESSTRPPSASNGPQIELGAEGNAVVAWQEPDQSGAARIWMRRIFGSTPGPILQASPSTWEGQPVTADADAFSLSVSPYAAARVAYRIAPTAGSALAGRLLSTALPPNFSKTAGTLGNPVLVDGTGPAPGGAGPPDVAIAETSNKLPLMRLDFLAGGQLRQVGLDASEKPVELPTPPGPPGQAGTAPVVAADPEGGGMVAYSAVDGNGQPAVAVRQEFSSGAAQAGLLSGVAGGPVSELAVGRSGVGDGLVGFLQGEAGHYEIVAERVSAPPATFVLEPPQGWARPNAVKLRWAAAPSSVGGVSYTVLVDGEPIGAGLRRLSFHPRPGQLGNGVLPTQVMATDSSGQQVLSGTAKLRVDGEAPLVRVHLGKGGKAVVKITDPDSGVQARATRVSFGDGKSARRGASFTHSYQAPGRYTIRVRARDRVGNRVVRSFRVRVR